MRNSYEVADKLIEMIENGDYKKITLTAEKIYGHIAEFQEYFEEYEKYKDNYEHSNSIRKNNENEYSFHYQEWLILSVDDSDEWKEIVKNKIIFFKETVSIYLEYMILQKDDTVLFQNDEVYNTEQVFDGFVLPWVYKF